MNIIYRATQSLLADPPAAILAGNPTKIAPERLDQILHDFGEELEAPQMDRDLVRGLMLEGSKRGYANDPSDQYALDRWLAPRLHNAIRLPRRITSDRAFWAWVAMDSAPEYICNRWRNGGILNPWRFTGGLLRNGVSRLWWAAELLRNGPDYSSVDLALRRVRTAQFALELKYSWYRPAAIAFVRVAEGSSPASDDEMSAMSRRANAYLPLAPLEAIGCDDREPDYDEAWWESATRTLADLTGPELLPGPEDGFADAEAIKALERWFKEIRSEIVVEGSGTAGGSPAAGVSREANEQAG